VGARRDLSQPATVQDRQPETGWVGHTGKAYGVDMTHKMLSLARANAVKAGATNVEFIEGTIQQVPLRDASVDVVIGNCVINLSVDKPAVLAELYRVLIPGGQPTAAR